MEKEEITNTLRDIMINDGPDGHCDGAEVLASFVEALLRGEGAEWSRDYFNGKERHFTSYYGADN